MNRILISLLSIGMVCVICGCSRDSLQKMGSKEDACFPNKPAVHVVEMTKVKINDKEFTSTDGGDPLPIRIYLVEEEMELEAVGGGMLSGTRGERTIDPPLRWTVDFKPDSRYQIVVEEQGPSGQVYVFPDVPRPGFWPIPANNFTFKIGKSSYLKFAEEVRTSDS